MNIIRCVLIMLVLWACLPPCPSAGFSLPASRQESCSLCGGWTEYSPVPPLMPSIHSSPAERFSSGTVIGDGELPAFHSDWSATPEEISKTLVQFLLKDVSAGLPLDGVAPSSTRPFPLPLFSERPVSGGTRQVPLPALVPPKYGLAAAQVRRMSAEGVAVLVDVRDAAVFERVRIPDSQNIPLFAVKTKNWLKSRSVILVDEGGLPGELNAACEQLQSLGFKAWFLLGGLAGWNAAGGEFEGDVFAQQSVTRLSAGQWLTDTCKGCWLVVDASAAEPLRAIPGAQRVWLPFDPDTPQDFAGELGDIASGVSIDGKWLILIVSDFGQEYDEIERSLEQMALPPFFFLKGGTAAYHRAVIRRRQLLQSRQAVPTPCSPCSR